MQLVDTHCHLHWLSEAHNLPLDTLMDNARQAGVQHFLCVAITLDDVSSILDLCRHYPDVYASVGLHPNEVRAAEPTIEELIALADDPAVIAIGESGLDYYRTEGAQPWQQERFRTHIRAAKATGLPLIVHTRQAQADTIRILQEEHAEEVGGVMHCFTEDMAMAEEALALGFYISLAGVVTFKNAANLQEVARQVPLSRLLLETDCPYLAPLPFRGKPNQPAYVRYVAEKIAELKNITLEEVAEQTTQNFLTCFSKVQQYAK
ncbi:MAG: TatD family hydrolase [Pseudomonadota bacterium]|nr:TatD family hydrolase [Pseudomonadota bacterium]